MRHPVQMGLLIHSLPRTTVQRVNRDHRRAGVPWDAVLHAGARLMELEVALAGLIEQPLALEARAWALGAKSGEGWG